MKIAVYESRKTDAMTLLRFVIGFIGGIVATGPMSVVMILLHRRLPTDERYPLPPREITAKAVEQITEPGELKASTYSALTWLAHFGYGGAAGIIYAGVERRLPGGITMRGPLFGLLLWAVSYLGLLPGLRVLTPATEHPLRRSALMIVAHLVWGWSLAVVFQMLCSDRARENAAFCASLRRHRDVRSQNSSSDSTAN